MKKILFIFMLMVLVIPLQVKAETESALGITYSVVGGKSIFQFGDGHYLKIPLDIVVDSKEFDVLNIIETDIDFSKLKVEYKFDLEKDNNMRSEFVISYKDRKIYTPVYIEVKEYINIQEEITVDNFDFDIWNYIETNIGNKNDIEIIGEYDLNINGKYEILINYKDISKNTTILVDIKENDSEEQIKNEEKKELEENNTCKQNLTYETKNYISKYYTYNTEEVKELTCPNIEMPTPINKTVYNDNPINELFYYISYIFYGLVVILLSINVVRKK